jgi:hypothetical protein
MTNDMAYTYASDAEGRVLRIDGGSTLKETYNALGWRVEAINCCGGVVDYLHDAAGNMVGGTANAARADRSSMYTSAAGCWRNTGMAKGCGLHTLALEPLQPDEIGSPLNHFTATTFPTVCLA